MEMGVLYMKVTQLAKEQQGEFTCKKRSISNEQLQREFDYFRAEKILKAMLEKGLINECEFNKITKLNRKTFSPFLAEIMP